MCLSGFVHITILYTCALMTGNLWSLFAVCFHVLTFMDFTLQGVSYKSVLGEGVFLLQCRIFEVFQYMKCSVYQNVCPVALEVRWAFVLIH